MSSNSKNEYLSRWAGIDAVGLLPHIFPEPGESLSRAVMTLYEPPRDLLERYLRGGRDGLEALEAFFQAAAGEGEVFTISRLLRDLVSERGRAERERRLADQTLMWVLWRHLREEALSKSVRDSKARIKARPQDAGDECLRAAAEGALAGVAPVEARLSELVVHPFNARFVSHGGPAIRKFKAVCEDGGLKEPLLVVPVAPRNRLAELHVAMFEMIEEKVRRRAERDDETRRAVEEGGVGLIMRALTGYREVMVEDGRIVFTENDRLRQITGVREPKYFIIDGQLRALAMMLRFEEGVDRGSYDPSLDTVGVQVIEDADPLTVTYLSITLNSGIREIGEDDQRLFLRAVGPVNNATLSLVAERTGSSLLGSLREFGAPSPDLDSTGQPHIILTQIEEEDSLLPPGPIAPEEDESDRAGAGRSGAAASRQTGHEAGSASTVPGGGPSPSSGPQPGSEPWGTSLEREQAQPQPVMLDEASILSALFSKYLDRAAQDQLGYYIIPGKGVSVRLEHSLKAALEARGLGPRQLAEPDIRYTNMVAVPVYIGGRRLRVTLHAPVAWNKYCPRCGRLVVLSPARCLFCGEILYEYSPLPYYLSYAPE
jgi:hypothetical protein